MLKIAKDFSAYFLNLAENLESKLPNPSNKYGVLSVAQYYSHLGLTKKFQLLPTEKRLYTSNFDRYPHLKTCWH